MTTALSMIYHIDQLIDTFALGHYARVFEAIDRRSGRTMAFKVLRSEHLSEDGDIRWEYRAFPHEADLLMKLSGCPQVVDLYDCGYLASESEVPSDGEIISFERDVQAFTQAMFEYAEAGWRPYLALENMPRSNNLLYLMKPNRPDVRWRLPTEEGLALAMQFGQVLKLAHSQNIAYLDHKLEHIYWDGSSLNIIDLNSSRMADNTNRDQYFRMDIHNLCVGILYPIFTGLSPQKTALRPQPSGLAEVEARYQDIVTLDFGVEPTLSEQLQKVLQRGAEHQIETADQFIAELSEVCALHGWDLPKHTTQPANRQGRDHMRNGLRKMREGQDAIRQARDLFREAAIVDGITPDLEDELRRLVKAANEMLNNRVIP
jgi:serine/threonine protein kinase